MCGRKRRFANFLSVFLNYLNSNLSQTNCDKLAITELELYLLFLGLQSVSRPSLLVFHNPLVASAVLITLRHKFSFHSKVTTAAIVISDNASGESIAYIQMTDSSVTDVDWLALWRFHTPFAAFHERVHLNFFDKSRIWKLRFGKNFFERY